MISVVVRYGPRLWGLVWSRGFGNSNMGTNDAMGGVSFSCCENSGIGQCKQVRRQAARGVGGGLTCGDVNWTIRIRTLLGHIGAVYSVEIGNRGVCIENYYIILQNTRGGFCTAAA